MKKLKSNQIHAQNIAKNYVVSKHFRKENGEY